MKDYSLLGIELKLLIIVTLAAVPFIFSLNGDFVFDDSVAITKNKDVISNNFLNAFYNDFWGTNISSNISHKSYRPLTINTFRLNYIISGHKLNPYHFKVTNLLCHIICSFILFFAYRIMIVGSITLYKYRRKANEDIPLLATILFAVHPVHTEAVSGIVGRADVLAAIIYFASFISYHCSMKSHTKFKMGISLLLSIMLAFVSMLFKENGITVLGFCLMYEIIVNEELFLFCKKQLVKLMNVDLLSRESVENKQNVNPLVVKGLLRVIIILLSSVIMLAIRWQIMGRSLPQFKAIDNPAAFEQNLFKRVATYNYLYLMNALLLVWPQWLCYDWSMGCIPLIEPYDLRLIFILLFDIFSIVFIGMVLFFIRSNCERRLISISLVSIIVPFVPASNIFVTVGFVLAERVLYIPSAGYCLLVAIGANKLMKQKRFTKCAWCVYVCVVCVCVGRSWQRAWSWHSEWSLYVSGLSVCPHNAKLHYNLANVAHTNNHTDWAISHYRHAISLYPEYYQAMNNLANILRSHNQLDEAERLLRRALALKSDFSAAWMNLGIVLSGLGRHRQSERAYRTALHHRTRYPDCHYNLANLYLEMNNSAAAVASFLKAIDLDPRHVLAWTNLLTVLDNEGRQQEAVAYVSRAVRAVPDAVSVRFVCGTVLTKSGLYADAELHYAHTLRLAGEHAKPIHHNNFGVMYHRWKKYREAEKQYKLALQIDPNLKSALNNLKAISKYL